jgi:hypothetical protein
MFVLYMKAAVSGGATRASFIASTLRELSVGLLRRGNFLMYHASGSRLAQVSGRVFRARLAVRTEKAIE